MARASAYFPASARCSTAATVLAASTLTVPPGRSTRATAASAADGESTYSSTLWQITRSAPPSPAPGSPTRAGRSAASPWTSVSVTPRLGGPPARGGEGVGARVHHGHPVPEAGDAHREPAGPRAHVDDVQGGPRPACAAARRDHLCQDVPDQRRSRPVTLTLGVRAHACRARLSREPLRSLLTTPQVDGRSLTVVVAARPSQAAPCRGASHGYFMRLLHYQLSIKGAEPGTSRSRSNDRGDLIEPVSRSGQKRHAVVSE